MALLLSGRGIGKTYGELNLLCDISFDIAEGERIGLVGRNGAGKTTLARIISGRLDSDQGQIIWHKKNVYAAYLDQLVDYPENCRNEGQDQACPGEAADLLKISGHLGIKRLLEGDRGQFMGLSGGEKTKLKLTRIWAYHPDVVILDEPTNNLDIKGMDWLVEELDKYRGAALIISHDRYFLDQTVDKIFEIENGGLTHFKGNYSFYREEKQRCYENSLHQYEKQEKIRQAIADNIEQLNAWSAKAHRESRAKAAESGAKKGGKEYFRAKAKKRDRNIKSKIKQLQKIEIEGITKPEDESRVKFAFAKAGRGGRRVLEAQDISKSFGDRVLFDKSSFYVKHGEKVGIYGPNGCGKTTLIKAIVGEGSLTGGQLYLSPALHIGYLNQDVDDLNGDMKVAEILDIAKYKYPGPVITLLVNLGLSVNILCQPLKTLSFGERRKIKLAQMLQQQNDLLILDEPGNHLDLPSREELEETLVDYNGTVLLVSHDRYMLKRVCNTMLVLEGKRIKRWEGGWEAYQENCQADEYGYRILAGDIKAVQEEKLLLETRLAYWLSEISRYPAGEAEYIKADKEIRALIKRKHELS